MNPATIDRNADQDRALIDLDQYGTVGRSEWMDIDWAAHTHIATVGQDQIEYVEYGAVDAPPLILIHGLAASWQCWLENIPALARDFRVIAIDLPGFGRSKMPRDQISIPGYARVVAELMDSLGIERASLIGNSMGGQTSLRFALDYPERVERVILVSPAGYSTSTLPSAARNAASVFSPAIRPLLGANREIAARPRLRKRVLYGICAHADQLSPDIVLQLMGFSKKPGFSDALDALLSHDFREELVNVATPVLIIWGRKDLLIGSGDAHRMAAKIPGSRKMVLNDTAHVAMVERPAWFNATAREFLLES
ncbi:MAG: alpha/beta fold hydrolase [Solirubrobacterales bacterium]